MLLIQIFFSLQLQVTTSLGHLLADCPTSHICIQGCYTYSECARDKQSLYFARITVKGSLQGLNSQPVPEKQDLVIGCVLLRIAYRYVGSCRCSLCSPCKPRSQPSSRYRAAGKAHLSTRLQDCFPSTRVPEGGAIPTCLPARLTATSLR